MVQIVSCMKGDLSVYNNVLCDNIVCSLGGVALSVTSDSWRGYVLMVSYLGFRYIYAKEVNVCALKDT